MKMDFKKVNWQAVGNAFSPSSLDNLNSFLERLPYNTNKFVVIVIGIVWLVAALLGLYTTVKIQEVAQLRAEREEEKALSPIVPMVTETSVSEHELKAFVDELQGIYKGLEIKVSSANIIIFAKSTAMFGQFREAIGHIQNGGLGWRVSVIKLCVGKECDLNPLYATLKVSRVAVKK